MFDASTTHSFVKKLPGGLQTLLKAIEKREPWVVNNSEKVDAMINDIGEALQSHRNIDRLSTLPTSELTVLFFGLTLTRYLSALNRLSEHPHYMQNIVHKLHNDINPGDLDTSNQQRILLARLKTLIKFDVISRTFSKDRRDRIGALLDGESYE